VEETPPEEWTLSLRVPGWAQGAGLRVDGDERPVPAGSYASVRRSWQAGDTVELTLPMTVRLVEADERIDAVRGCVAVERGPVVYAVEQVDLPAGVPVDDLRLDPAADTAAAYRKDLLGGVTVITAHGRAGKHLSGAWPYRSARERDTSAGNDVAIVAVPYFTWANRGIGPMRVWLPRV
jgi:DUF1680 family protein